MSRNNVLVDLPLVRWLPILALLAACDTAPGGAPTDASSGPDAVVAPDSFLSELARECQRRSVCDGVHLGTCLGAAANDDSWSMEGKAWRDAVHGRAACVEAAHDCKDLHQCLYPGSELEPCDPATFVQRCESDVVVRCEQVASGEAFQVTDDCAARGGKCADADGSVRCDLAPGVTCDGMPETRCEGDTLIWCVGEYDPTPIPFACADFGMTCKGGGCVDPSGATCAESACVDGKPQLCWQGRTHTLDCAVVSPDFACADDDGQLRCAVPSPDAGCEASGGPEPQCDGDVAKVCVRGKRVTVDCGSFLGGHCTTEGTDVRCGK